MTLLLEGSWVNVDGDTVGAEMNARVVQQHDAADGKRNGNAESL